ncbi:MAG: cytochrome b/b6 domain-containing protein [Rhodobacteraceae bacterium]|nr:cytochrome b/b6 domain-containing protein [Paracoccaceae bacterium]
MRKSVRVWDPLVRLFHWLLVVCFTLNAFVLDDDSPAHEYIGYAVLALVVVRLVWGVIGPVNARFSTFPPSLTAAMRHLEKIARGIPDHTVSHNPLGALMIYNLLATMLALGLTGHLLVQPGFHDSDILEELHELLSAWGVFSVVVHVAAVVFESQRTGVNLVKAMLTGNKEISDARGSDKIAEEQA